MTEHKITDTERKRAKAVTVLKTLIPMLSGQETNVSPKESHENTTDVQVKDEVIQDNTGEDSSKAGKDTEEADEESVDTMEEIGEETGDMGENEDGDESKEEHKNQL